MRTTHLAIVIVVMLVCPFAPHAQGPQTPARIDYDTYMQQDRDGRLRTFNRITPENRSELVREQIRRWVNANRSRLSDEQIAVMEEWIAFASPDHYVFPNTADTLARAKALEAKTEALFNREDRYQALFIGADYIPK